MKVSDNAMKLGQILWDYHNLDEDVTNSEIVVVSGHDIRLVDEAVKLYEEGGITFVIFCGGHECGEVRGLKAGRLRGKEAEVYRQKAIELGIPENAILLQDKSKNMGEVILLVRALIESKGLEQSRSAWIFEPDKQRRGRATLEKQWPGVSVKVTSLQISMEKYCNDESPMDTLIRQMVGNIRRIIEYPDKGFQTYQDVPEEVMDAYARLIALGFADGLKKYLLHDLC